MIFHFKLKAKINRWDCNSTGFSIKNQKCRVKSISRYVQTLSIEFEVVRKIESVTVRKDNTF
jgi:hypothetical protein